MLTGLFNRNRYMEDLSGWEKGTLREIGGIYMDLNGLKHCNDRFGHEAGDALIRRTADALNEVFPGEGYRIGGDEFVVLRCPIGQEDFADKVHQLREALVRHGVDAAIGSFWQLLLAVVFTGVIAAAGRINVGRLAASVRVFLALFVFCGLLNIFFVRTGTTVASLGPIPITDDGIRIALLYACRFAVVIVIGAMFLASTTPTAMTDAFESLLSPFARFGLHTQETALVMSLALRFLPTLGMETKAIIDAQSARGGSVETGSFVVRIKAMVAVVVPVFAAAIRHADNLSLALDARCYEEGATRTHWRVMRVTGMDVAVAIVVLVYLVALVVLL